MMRASLSGKLFATDYRIDTVIQGIHWVDGGKNVPIANYTNATRDIKSEAKG